MKRLTSGADPAPSDLTQLLKMADGVFSEARTVLRSARQASSYDAVADRLDEVIKASSDIARKLRERAPSS